MTAPLARATTPGKLRDGGKRARVDVEARHATDPTTAPPCRDAPRLRSGAGPGPADAGRGRRLSGPPRGGGAGRRRRLVTRFALAPPAISASTIAASSRTAAI